MNVSSAHALHRFASETRSLELCQDRLKLLCIELSDSNFFFVSVSFFFSPSAVMRSSCFQLTPGMPSSPLCICFQALPLRPPHQPPPPTSPPSKPSPTTLPKSPPQKPCPQALPTSPLQKPPKPLLTALCKSPPHKPSPQALPISPLHKPSPKALPTSPPQQPCPQPSSLCICFTAHAC